MKGIKEKKRLSVLVPDWNTPQHVMACTTLRQERIAEDSFSGFNLATHVGDELNTVEKNRNIVLEALALPSQPVWLRQTHSTKVVNLDDFENIAKIPEADAVYTTQKDKVCVILTADCLPLLVSDNKGTGVLAIHAGWRGLANGIITIAIEKFAQALNIKNSECHVWLGPAISQQYFEVGIEVYETFLQKNDTANEAFIQKDSEKYLCDLYHLARLELEMLNIKQVSGGHYCTYAQENEFYSYRRHTHQLQAVAKNNANTNLPSFLKADNTKIKSFTNDCGRQATFVWISDN